MITFYRIVTIKLKVKVIQLEALETRERGTVMPLSILNLIVIRWWVVKDTLRPLYRREREMTAIVQEDKLASGSV
jgi:type II secretory pathway component PulM